MKHWSIFVLTAIVLCAVSCMNDSRNKVEIKVISYNIRQSGLSDKDGEYQWNNRKEATLTMLQKENPSIFGLQEALLEQVEYIEQNLPQYSRIGVGRDDGKNAGEFMAIFYLTDKFDLLKNGTFWLSETPDSVSKGWDAECYRTATWVQLQDLKTGKSFYFFNTHFDHRGSMARANSAKLIAEEIKKIADKKAAVILCGDLNSAISDPIFNPLKKDLEIARECAPITDNKGSFNGFGSAPTSIVIDHIFFRKVTCKLFQTLDADYGAPYISDHYPIEFVFELK
jgi:endonuclease/exonuclease/phosphatase family metal-dependent hydrolase